MASSGLRLGIRWFLKGRFREFRIEGMQRTERFFGVGFMETETMRM